MDYNLTNLGSLDFENMVAALFEKQLGVRVGQFGIGPDAGREATFTGRITDLAGDSLDWDGFVVLQAKYRARPLGTSDDQDWLIKQVESELREWASTTSARREVGEIPDYLVIASNVVLTPAAHGGVNRLTAILNALTPKLGIKGWLVWHHDKICRMLDNASDIRRAYASLLTSGDVLSQLQNYLEGDAALLGDTVRTFTAQTLIHQRHVRLTESGGSGNLTLEQVAVDLPCEQGTGMAVETLLQIGEMDLRAGAHGGNTNPTLLLMGGPGQGKSTLSNLLAQVYRVAMLRDEPGRNGAQAAEILEETLKWAGAAGVPLPRKRRWPIRIDLAQEEIDGSLFKNITATVRRRTGVKVTAPQLQSWFKQWPWVLVLDGFDEVASAEARRRVYESVTDFLAQAASNGCDLLTVITTRPQGYDNEFEIPGVSQIVLKPLNTEQALGYARKFARHHFGDADEDRELVLRRLSSTSRDPNVSRLLQSPLQVTIMTLLLEDHGHAPRDRFLLFDAYYQTIYKREAAKPGELARILSEHRSDIANLHEQSGLELQRLSEATGSFDAALPSKELQALAKRRLVEAGHEDQEAEGLAAKLWDAASNRLVLLVPQGDGVGFEVRSLQEYMAARALTGGAESDVARRLHAVARSAHWRNTWLFALARVLQEREHMLPQVVAVIREPGDDPLARQLGIGVELAAALALEGTGAHLPRFRRELLETLLEAFELPPLPFPVSVALSQLAGESAVYKTKIFNVLARAEAGLPADKAAALQHVLGPLTVGNGPLAVSARHTLSRLTLDSAQKEAIAQLRVRYDKQLSACALEELAAFLRIKPEDLVDSSESRRVEAWMRQLRRHRVQVLKAAPAVVIGTWTGGENRRELPYPEGSESRLAIQTSLESISPEGWGAAIQITDSLWRALRRAPVGGLV